MPELWCVRRKILRHQRLCLVAGKYLEKAPQLPTPCTFPSAVSGSSWVSFAVWVVGKWKHWGRTRSWSCSQPLLWSPSSAFTLFSYIFLSFWLCSELWHKLILAFHCTLYYLFALVKNGDFFTCFECCSFDKTTLWVGVLHVCVSPRQYLKQELLKHNPTNSNLSTPSGRIIITHSKLNLGN